MTSLTTNFQPFLFSPGRDSPGPDFETPSVLMRIIHCVPIIGNYLSNNLEATLNYNISLTTRASKLVELINVKNQLKIASIVRSLLLAALIISGIALGIFSGPLALGIIGSPLFSSVVIVIIATVIVGVNALNIYKNKAVINELQSPGWTWSHAKPPIVF